MWVIYKKEIRSFLSSLIAYVVMIVFLIITGLFVWVVKGNNIFDLGQASLTVMFDIAPYIFIFLVSAVTMKSFSDERRLGTIELLSTRPISDLSIILGKFLACVTLVLLALVPTVVYAISVYKLGNPAGNMDTGAMIGSYFGLLLLGFCYAAIGIWVSSLTENQIVALLLTMALCFVFYSVLGIIGEIKVLDKIGKSLEWFGLSYHYESISRGLLDSRDIIYFVSFSSLFIWLTKLNLERRKI